MSSAAANGMQNTVPQPDQLHLIFFYKFEGGKDCPFSEAGMTPLVPIQLTECTLG